MKKNLVKIMLMIGLVIGLAGCGDSGAPSPAASGNRRPVAYAGADQSVTTGVLVAINGSESSDPDGSALTYAWSLTSKPVGSYATISNVTSSTAYLFPDVAGSYIVQLIVNDGTVASALDTTVVFATTGNLPPVANAGDDQSVATGVQVAINGNGSYDPDGSALTYAWSLTSKPVGSYATISYATSSTAYLTLDVAGSYTVQLIVNDGTVASAQDTTVVIATTGNRPPVANAGVDLSVATGAQVAINGSGSSDPDGSALTYAWSLTSKPVGSYATISYATSSTAYLTPDVAGSYIVQLIVNDGTVASAQDTTVVIATTGNRPPVANAGVDQSVATGVQVAINGSGSSDPDGSALTYAWSLTSKPVGSYAAISNATSSTAYLYPDVAGSYIVQLIVNDGTVASAQDTTVVIATTGNRPPVANAGVDQSVVTGVQVAFNGSGSYDPDGSALTYAWSLTSKPVGSYAAISNATSSTAHLTPDVAGSYTVQMVVSDGAGSTAADTVVVSASAVAPKFQTVICTNPSSGTACTTGESINAGYNGSFSGIKVYFYVQNIGGSGIIDVSVAAGVYTEYKQFNVVAGQKYKIISTIPANYSGCYYGQTLYIYATSTGFSKVNSWVPGFCTTGGLSGVIPKSEPSSTLEPY